MVAAQCHASIGTHRTRLGHTSSKRQSAQLSKFHQGWATLFYPIAILGVAIFDSYTPLRSAIRVGNEAAQLALLVAMLIVIFLSTLAYAVILADHLSEHREISDIKTRNISIFLTAISILLTYLAHSC